MAGRWTFVFAFVAGGLAVFGGLIVLRDAAGTEIEPFGWLLIVIGGLTVLANVAIWKQRR